MTTAINDIPIIDTDTHVVEPPDLWTSRFPSARWGDGIPHVRWDEAAEEAWFTCIQAYNDYLLPSEYFARQVYGCFWFERDSAHSAIAQLGADNILYEIDFPHPTSMSPGPASTAVRPDQYLRETFSDLDPSALRKIPHDNAARLYHLD